MGDKRMRTTVRFDRDKINEAKIKMLRSFGEENMTKLFRIFLERYIEGEIEVNEAEWIEGDKL
ncbi:MAG: hypothetical protein ACLFPS_09680 [Clostridia bacterium]